MLFSEYFFPFRQAHMDMFLHSAPGSNPRTFCALIRLLCIHQLRFVGSCSFLLFVDFAVISVCSETLASLVYVSQQQVFVFYQNQ